MCALKATPTQTRTHCVTHRLFCCLLEFAHLIIEVHGAPTKQLWDQLPVKYQNRHEHASTPCRSLQHLFSKM